ncbi:MAG: hypothetical protein ABS35_30360 [Kaistia sp. SCN 65-12]|mgnify:FL=1|nr:MAG: hypothetical protein ABS35_30360 [Kaistia sp. SCN 65-12]
MSIVVAVPGNVQQPASLKLPNTSVNDVLSLSVDTSGGVTTVIGIVIVNQDAAAQKVTVWWNDGAADYALFERSVGANDTVTVALDAPIVLYTKVTAKKIKAQAAKADAVTVTVLYTLASQRAQA